MKRTFILFCTLLIAFLIFWAVTTAIYARPLEEERYVVPEPTPTPTPTPVPVQTDPAEAYHQMGVLTPEEQEIYDRYMELYEQDGMDGAVTAVAKEFNMSKMEAMIYTIQLYKIDLKYNKRLTPECFKDQVLLPILDYHPGTAGSTLTAAATSYAILEFILDNDLRFTDQDYVNRRMAEAVALLTEDEKSQLTESTPGIVDFIDETLEFYPENRDIYADAGCSLYMMDYSLTRPFAAEDWAPLKTALLAAVPPAESPTS